MTNFELLKLSFEVAQSTVAKYMVKRYETALSQSELKRLA